MDTSTTNVVNGIDTDMLRATAEQVAADPSKGMTAWRVTTDWVGGTRSDTRVESCDIGGQTVAKDFTIGIDEPAELCGTNQFPNPQEYLLAAMNACMAVGYVAVCALEGIRIEQLRVESSGEIDLRGFLGLSPDVKPGYDEIGYTVRIKADATREQLEKVHEAVTTTSPNRFNIAEAIRLDARLVVE